MTILFHFTAFGFLTGLFGIDLRSSSKAEEAMMKKMISGEAVVQEQNYSVQRKKKVRIGFPPQELVFFVGNVVTF